MRFNLGLKCAMASSIDSTYEEAPACKYILALAGVEGAQNIQLLTFLYFDCVWRKVILSEVFNI